MDSFACSLPDKVFVMSDSGLNDCFEARDYSGEPLFEEMAADEDLIMEQILENMNTTPIGQVLRKIASLPEIRREKVLDVRRQLTEGKYDLNERLDVALEKVLDDLTT
jgi:hypothetical protein